MESIRIEKEEDFYRGARWYFFESLVISLSLFCSETLLSLFYVAVLFSGF